MTVVYKYIKKSNKLGYIKTKLSKITSEMIVRFNEKAKSTKVTT